MGDVEEAEPLTRVTCDACDRRLTRSEIADSVEIAGMIACSEACLDELREGLAYAKQLREER